MKIQHIFITYLFLHSMPVLAAIRTSIYNNNPSTNPQQMAQGGISILAKNGSTNPAASAFLNRNLSLSMMPANNIYNDNVTISTKSNQSLMGEFSQPTKMGILGGSFSIFASVYNKKRAIIDNVSLEYLNKQLDFSTAVALRLYDELSFGVGINGLTGLESIMLQNPMQHIEKQEYQGFSIKAGALFQYQDNIIAMTIENKAQIWNQKQVIPYLGENLAPPIKPLEFSIAGMHKFKQSASNNIPLDSTLSIQFDAAKFENNSQDKIMLQGSALGTPAYAIFATDDAAKPNTSAEEILPGTYITPRVGLDVCLLSFASSSANIKFGGYLAPPLIPSEKTAGHLTSGVAIKIWGIELVASYDKADKAKTFLFGINAFETR